MKQRLGLKKKTSKEEKGTPLKDTIKGILGKLEGNSREGSIKYAWENVVGPDKAGHTKLVSFQKGRLVVNVSDSTRLYELTLNKRKIIAELNGAISKKTVREIRFKIGEI